MKKIISTFISILIFLTLPKAIGGTFISLPEGFVYLDKIDPSIQVSLRYFTGDNFAGKKILGYNDEKVILTQKAADALKKAQAIFKEKGLSLVIYDAFRPQQSVDYFATWGKEPFDQYMKAWYYPRIEKDKFFELEYLRKKSSHTRGSSVDVTLIPLGKSIKPFETEKRVLNDKFEFIYLDDGTLDMGSHFSFLDEASYHDSPLVGSPYAESRAYLKEVMTACGFKSFKKEWWHYTLDQEPFPHTYFDFPIE